MAPEVCAMSPLAIRSNVDLPQPLGPTMDTNSPAATLTLVSSNACVPSGYVRPADVDEKTTLTKYRVQSLRLLGLVVGRS